MKKIFAALFISGFLIACGDTAGDNDSATDAGTSTDTVAPVDNSSANGTMKDGVMAMKDGKMMVMTSGSWQPMTEAVTCTNGRVVTTSGEVSKGDRKKTLEEGQMIDRDGQMMDKDGKMMDNTGWE